ncbi:MAG: DUF4349 domain-containing protein [Polyangiaceae bacterium]
MAQRALRFLKCVSIAAFLACGACGGSAEKQVDYAPTPAAYPAQTGAAAGGESMHVQAESAPPPEATFEADEAQGALISTNDATTRSAPMRAPTPPPPPSAPPKPQVSATDKKIENVDIDHDGTQDAPTTPAKGGQSGPQTTKTSTAASADVSPHKSDFLIYTAQITMAVYQVAPGLAAVEQIAKDLGGYLSVRNDTSITIRVPRAAFDEAIRRIGLTGDVVHKEISAEDVTDQYVDMEARLKNAKAMRDRLQDLLQRAQVKEAIEIQAQLGKVTEEIERLEGQLKLMKDKIAYSSIAVNFAPRGNAALQDMPLRLPFPWLQELGLPRLMSLHE